MKTNRLRMQCKDIQDKSVLEYLLSHKGKLCYWQGGTPNVTESMPTGTPSKLALAKMTTLIIRGLVSGCTCGCSGYFEITEKGERFISTTNQWKP